MPDHDQPCPSAGLLEDIACDRIDIGPRHRQDVGDLEALAASIDKLGLLHPIGVALAPRADPDQTLSDWLGEERYRLVYGERRFRAVRDLLHHTHIPAMIVDLDALLAEHDENELAKPFTTSEKVSIAAALKDKIGERRGRPKEADVTPTPQKPSGKAPAIIPEPVPELSPEPGQETRDAVAKAAGLGTGKTLQAAEKVVEKGTPALVAAMDTGAIPIKTAAAAAELPAPKQEEVVNKVKGGTRPRKALEEVQAQAEPEPEPDLPRDDDGLVIPFQLRAAFASLAEAEEAGKLIRALEKAMDRLVRLPGMERLRRHAQSICRNDKITFRFQALHDLLGKIKLESPSVACCPYCHHDHPGRVDAECNVCLGLGWLTADAWKGAQDDYKETARAARVELES
jgi:ParB family chromosome partitioning protein